MTPVIRYLPIFSGAFITIVNLPTPLDPDNRVVGETGAVEPENCRRSPSIGGTPGFQAGGFGFNLAGVVGQTVIVEASTNLLNWTALATNQFDTSVVYFNDSATMNFSSRFYRAMLQ